MSNKLIYSIFILFSFIILFSSCSDDDPIEAGVSVKVNNTFQSDAFTGGIELSIEEVFQTEFDALSATAVVSDDVEFPAYLLGLYDIDISENTISFDCVAGTNDPTYGDLFRILEPNTFDRYYFKFATPHNITGFESNNGAVTLSIVSDTEIAVVIGAGYDFNPDIAFSIELSN